MNRFIEYETNDDYIPRPIYLKVGFDEELQKITEKKEIPVVMAEGSSFLYLLENILIEYPDIKKYPPQFLDFKINGKSPKVDSPILDGDIVMISVFKGINIE